VAVYVAIYSFTFISAFMHCSDTIQYKNESLMWNVNNSECK